MILNPYSIRSRQLHVRSSCLNLVRHHIGGAVFSGEHGVGFGVAGELRNRKESVSKESEESVSKPLTPEFP